MISKHFILAFVILVLSCLSCGRDPVSPPTGKPTRYYLRDKDELSQEPGPSDSWIYITAYINSSGDTASWMTFLTKNISESSYGHDLIVRSDSDARLRIEFVLDHEGAKSVLATKDFDILGTTEETAIGLKGEVEGTNPLSGKGDTLIFRITLISGTKPLEIYYDGGLGYAGNASITIPLI